MIYVSSSCLEKKYISDIIIELAEGGIRNIELSGGTEYYPGLEADLMRLKKAYGLQYACHAYFPPPKEHFVINLASCNDRIYEMSIQHYLDCIALLKEIGCAALSIHAGFLVEIRKEELGGKANSRVVYKEEEAYDRFCSAYTWIEKRCREAGIQLYLENNVLSAGNFEAFGGKNYLMMTDYASIQRMKERMDFALLLDLAHLHVSAHTLGLDYQEECRKLGPDVKWLHMSENQGVVDEHKPLQNGSVIVNAYRDMGLGDVPVTLETKGNREEIRKSISILE